MPSRCMFEAISHDAISDDTDAISVDLRIFDGRSIEVNVQKAGSLLFSCTSIHRGRTKSASVEKSQTIRDFEN